MTNKRTEPIQFQGHMKKHNYFEGWYFKQVSEQSGRAIAFIPGISLNRKDPHAFVQVILSHPVQTYYFRFPTKAFRTTTKPFSVRVGHCYFSENQIIIDLENTISYFKGHLTYGPLSPIKQSLITPNIMGYFSYLPYMACNHGVISMSHKVGGWIESHHDLLVFHEDLGYIEKDWGTSFPERYLWLQGNHFDLEHTSMMLSVATIPMAHTGFIGHLANVHIQDQEYRFATYNGSKIIKATAIDHQVHVVLKRKDLTLEIQGTITDSGSLLAPKEGHMVHTIKEGLGGSIHLSLKEKKRLRFEGITEFSGIEVVGDFIA